MNVSPNESGNPSTLRDQIAATEDLLCHIGISVGLSEFPHNHLTEILQKQHPAANVETITVDRIDGCELSLFPQEDNEPIAYLSSLTIPIHLTMVISHNEFRQQLQPKINIHANASEHGGYVVTTDVFFQQQ